MTTPGRNRRLAAVAVVTEVKTLYGKLRHTDPDVTETFSAWRDVHPGAKWQLEREWTRPQDEPVIRAALRKVMRG